MKSEFYELVEKAFSDDADEALEASAKLAELEGVPEDQILHNIDEVDKYFTE